MASMDLVTALPIERNATECSWTQRSSYAQGDLHEDLVADISDAVPINAAPDVEVRTIAIVGDRNAGKTTLLHALINEHDRDWLRVSSLLPIVAGVFENRRYGGGPCSPERPPVAEPPYLDTDVASCTALLSAEDFRFLCSEFEGIEACSSTSAYVALRLVEVGGDHLEALVGQATPTQLPLLEAALERSKSVLAKADAHAYFLNAKSLVEEGDAPAKLAQRIDWLRALSGDAKVSLYVSREPDHVDIAKIIDALPPTSSVVGEEDNFDDNDDDDDDAERRAVLAALRRDAQATPLCRALKERLPVVSARSVHHVRPGHGAESRVDAAGLVALVVSLLRRRRQVPDEDASQRYFARHVTECCAMAATTVEDGVNDPWVDARRFGDFVGARDGGNSCCGNASVAVAAAPASRRFGDVAAGLCERGVLVRHARHGHAAVVVRGDGFTLVPPSQGCKRAASAMDVDQPMEIPGVAPPAASDTLFCRAPFSPALRRVVRKATEHGLVAGPSDDLPAALKPALADAIAALDRDLAGALAALDASKPASLRRVLWYAEERIAAARLAGGSGDVEVAVGALPVQALAHYSSAAVSDSAWGVVRVKSC